jgi:hypothetical protein
VRTSLLRRAIGFAHLLGGTAGTAKKPTAALPKPQATTAGTPPDPRRKQQLSFAHLRGSVASAEQQPAPSREDAARSWDRAARGGVQTARTQHSRSWDAAHANPSLQPLGRGAYAHSWDAAATSAGITRR